MTGSTDLALRARLRSLAAAAALACLGAVGAVGPDFQACAAEFSSPPTLSSRRVLLSWAPDSDDPVFTGNTVAQQIGRYAGIHSPGREVVAVVMRGSGDNAWSYAAGETVVSGWTTADGVVRETLDLPPGAEVLALSAHGSDRYVLAALASGDLVLWDRETTGREPRVISVTDAPLRDVRFVRGSLDEDDVRFAVIGTDQSIRVFASAEDPPAVIVTPDGAPTSLDLIQAPQGALLAVGSSSGRVRLWNLTQDPQIPSFSLDGHTAPVLDVVYSPDFRRLGSIDSSGELRIWDVTRGALLSVAAVGATATQLGFSAPDGAILFVSHSDGRVELRDGLNAALYRVIQVADETVSFALATDGRRLAVGDSDGVVTVTRAGRCIASAIDPVCFGGYKIFRSPTPSESDVVLLRSYNFGDSTWAFAGDERLFSDSDSIIPRRNPFDPLNDDFPQEPAVLAGPHNGVPYFYSLVRFDYRFYNGAVFEVYQNTIQEGFYRDPGATSPTPLAAIPPSRSELPELGEVYAVPNPYELGSVPWDRGADRRIELRNLPGRARISIYTVNGDLVRVLEHGVDRYGEERGVASWDLKNSSGRLVVSGVYLYRVETPSGEVIQGYLALVL